MILWILLGSSFSGDIFVMEATYWYIELVILIWKKKNSLVTSVSRYFESKFFTVPTVILRMTFWNIWSLKEIGIKVRGFGKNFYIYWIIKFELLKDFVCKWRRVIRRAGWFWQFFQFFHGIFYAWNFFKLFRVFDI